MSKLKLQILKVGTSSISNRTYPKDEVINAIKKFNEKYNDSVSSIGYCYPQSNDSFDTVKNTPLEYASHIVNSLDIDDDGNVYAILEIMSTEKGKQLANKIIDDNLDNTKIFPIMTGVINSETNEVSDLEFNRIDFMYDLKDSNI